MKLITYRFDNKFRIGAVTGDKVLDLNGAATASGVPFPANMLSLLQAGEPALKNARDLITHIAADSSYLLDLPLQWSAPIPNPPSMRDGYAFRQHVETARRNRGAPMIPEFDQFPVFYFTNHGATLGPGPVRVMERHLERLDFELECAIVIGKKGRNITASQADEYIAGYTIMNDLSARAMQLEEMKLNLGPAKGKDFGTVIGPWLVTRDELEHKRIPGPNGDRYDLNMTATVNGVQVSQDNLSNMNWTFAQIIERASYGVDLRPGDVIGSGTCGTGCFLELNGSKITDNQWLQVGDRIELEIEGLGILENTIEQEP